MYVHLNYNLCHYAKAVLDEALGGGADGSGDRAIAPGSYAAGFDWDPTGRYIIARSQNGLVVIDVQAGSVLPLGWSQPFLMPAWRPCSGC